jgi:hypothetical protein
MDVVIYRMRCGLAIVLRCWGLSKVRCGGDGLVLHGVWPVLESTKYLFLGVDPYRTTCATTCLVWNDLAGGTDYKLIGVLEDVSSQWRELWVKCGTLGIRKVQSGRVKCGTPTHSMRR